LCKFIATILLDAEYKRGIDSILDILHSQQNLYTKIFEFLRSLFILENFICQLRQLSDISSHASIGARKYP